MAQYNRGIETNVDVIPATCDKFGIHGTESWKLGPEKDNKKNKQDKKQIKKWFWITTKNQECEIAKWLWIISENQECIYMIVGLRQQLLSLSLIAIMKMKECVGNSFFRTSNHALTNRQILAWLNLLGPTDKF